MYSDNHSFTQISPASSTLTVAAPVPLFPLHGSLAPHVAALQSMQLGGDASERHERLIADDAHGSVPRKLPGGVSAAAVRTACVGMSGVIACVIVIFMIRGMVVMLCTVLLRLVVVGTAATAIQVAVLGAVVLGTAVAAVAVGSM